MAWIWVRVKRHRPPRLPFKPNMTLPLTTKRLFIVPALALLNWVTGPSPERWEPCGAVVGLIGAVFILLSHIEATTLN